MKIRTLVARWAAIGLAGTMLLAACGGSAAPTASPAGASAAPGSLVPAESMAPGESMAPAESMAPGESMAPAESPAESMAATAAPSANPAAAVLASKAWATATLTDVSTGETFTIAERAGRPVFIEMMAIWCTNCRAQQRRFTDAIAMLPPGAIEYVVLTVDPSETAEDLARYEAERGFAGSYAVAGKALSRALEAEFGANVLNPPSVPLIRVSRTGEVTFSTGPESVEAIVAAAGG